MNQPWAENLPNKTNNNNQFVNQSGIKLIIKYKL